MASLLLSAHLLHIHCTLHQFYSLTSSYYTRWLTHGSTRAFWSNPVHAHMTLFPLPNCSMPCLPNSKFLQDKSDSFSSSFYIKSYVGVQPLVENTWGKCPSPSLQPLLGTCIRWSPTGPLTHEYLWLGPSLLEALWTG